VVEGGPQPGRLQGLVTCNPLDNNGCLGLDHDSLPRRADQKNRLFSGCLSMPQAAAVCQYSDGPPKRQFLLFQVA
jgi:hypothetical protein